MESLVTSLETSELLKAAGFPQEAYAAYYRKGHYWVGSEHVEATEPELMVYEGTNLDFPWMIVAVAPSAQEIADQLKPLTNKHGRLDVSFALISDKASDNIMKWVAAFNDYNLDAEGQADTMAEALALLWLKLHEAQQ